MQMEHYINYFKEKYNRILLSKQEVATELNRSTATIDRMRKAGKLRSKKVGGEIFFTIDEIARFLAA